MNPKQKRILLQKNAGVCCVCKERGIGVNFHHIDGNNSNSAEENIAVLCVKDHDAHHRPIGYSELNHVELGAQQILEYKQSWESFVKEASKPNPNILAVINTYGDLSNIHSMRLIFQRTDINKIEYERIYHLLTGKMETWIDNALEEINWLGKEIKLVLIDEPLEISYCPCCSKSLSNTVNAGISKKLTSDTWNKDSVCTVYINPENPSLALFIFLNKEIIFHSNLHLCTNNKLHFSCDSYEERISIKSKPSIRAQATSIINKILSDWEPAKILLGTGDPESPELINKLTLPKCWENKTIL